MNSSVLSIVLEAGARSLAAALAVWIALRLLRVRNVPAQKAAWTLVLAAALATPFAMRSNWLPASATIHLPALSWLRALQPRTRATRPASAAPNTLAESATQPADAPDRFPAPSITRSSEDAQSNSLNAAAPDNDLAGNGPAATAATSDPPLAGHTKNLAPQSSAPARRPWPVHPLTLAWLLYLAVAAVLILRLIAGLTAALRIWFAARPVPSSMLAEYAPGAGVRASSRVASPVNIASGIVLPADFAAWDPEKLRIVLAHERSHVRQADFYLQFLAGLYAALFWFSPLGWWLRRKLSELGEALSDRAGLEHAASRTSYAELLLEFASLPRPTVTGVAMARTGNLAPRIERLLNESIFRQAFAAGRRRALLVILVVPAALFASTAIVRVQAAAQTTPQIAPAQQASLDQAQTQTPPDTGVSKPPQQPITDQAPTSPPPAAAPAPAPAAAPLAAPAPVPFQTPDAAPAPQAVPAPDVTIMPPVQVQVPPIPPMPNINVQVDKAMRAQMEVMRNSLHRNYDYLFQEGGDSWALVDRTGSGSGDSQSHDTFIGHFHDASHAEFENARKMAHGPFFWFEHDGKSYIVEDPSIVAEIESMQKPMEDLRSKMRALGKQQRESSEQLRQQMREQRRAAIPKPDLSKEMAELNAAVDSLKASQGNTVSQEQLREIQRRLGEIQGQIGRLESGLYAKDGEWSDAMRNFSEQEGKLGAEQGQLAGQLSSMAAANHDKIQTIIDQTLKDGKATPVQNPAK